MLTESISLTTDNRLAYVIHEDICQCFKGDTLLAIQAPSGTQLEVPIPETVSTKTSVCSWVISVCVCLRGVKIQIVYHQ